MDKLVCPICGGDAYFYYRYDDYFGTSVSIHKCINCGHGFHDREYSPDELLQIYKDDYAEEYIDTQNIAYQKRKTQYALDVEGLVGLVKGDSIAVLDYGCSSGEYLCSMPERWDKSGYEVNATEIEHIRQTKKHITIYDDLAKMDRKYDLITLRGVIEHIPDHSDLIQFLENHTIQGGSVYITATPDFSSICATLYKSRWNQVVCPEHIHQFSTASLSLLLAKAGFALRSLNHPYHDTPYADWPRDKELFINNYRHLEQGQDSAIQPTHAFPGTMISALYEKVR